MITCLLAEMDKSALKAVSNKKIKKIIQGPDKNPSAFYHHSTEMIKYTHLTTKTIKGRFYLHLHFSSQSAPDIQN
jgi:hypothetical protein